MKTSTDFSGYTEQGWPMYRNTADGPQCTGCGLLGGEHAEECENTQGGDDGECESQDRTEAG